MLGRYTVMCRVPYYAPCLPVFCCCRSFLFVCCIGLYAGHPYIHWIHLKSFYFACLCAFLLYNQLARALHGRLQTADWWPYTQLSYCSNKAVVRLCLFTLIILVTIASAASMWELHACMSTVTTLTLLFFCRVAITEGPVSVSALVGENAQFHCAGTGTADAVILRWIVDKLLATDTNIRARGIVSHTVTKK